MKLKILFVVMLLTFIVGCQAPESTVISSQKVLDIGDVDSPGTPSASSIYQTLLDKVPQDSKYMRPKESDLNAMLEAGQVDYFFTYRNIAIQHELTFLELPSEINFGSKDFADFYDQASITLLDGTVKKGRPIEYGITIPKNARHPELAVEFIKMVLGPEGKDVMERNGQPFVTPARTNDLDLVPEYLHDFFAEEDAEVEEDGVDEDIKFQIFHAGSLTLAFKDFEDMFEEKYPSVDVINEPHGSRTAVKQVTEVGREADVVGVADFSVIPSLMFPDFADWYAIFAKNEMVLIYDEKSMYQDEITKDNWYELLARDDVIFARSDPNQDPAGYRTVLLWKLADLHYD